MEVPYLLKLFCFSLHKQYKHDIISNFVYLQENSNTNRSFHVDVYFSYLKLMLHLHCSFRQQIVTQEKQCVITLYKQMK